MSAAIATILERAADVLAANPRVVQHPKHQDLWSMKPGESMVVPVSDFTLDFKVMIGQLGDEVGVDPKELTVVSEPITKFKQWAEGEDPDWDRYLGITAQYLYDQKLIDQNTYNNYDSPKGFKVMEEKMADEGYEDPYKFGFKLYIKQLAEHIKQKKGLLPPLLELDGVPADGRHRTLAAIKLGLKYVPVANITANAGVKP